VAYRLSTGVAGTVGHMTTQYVVPPEKVRIGAGTALKFGFFAAFGIFLFYLILSVILGTVAILLASAGAFNINNLLPG
jgi:type III secretory pathway component EscV